VPVQKRDFGNETKHAPKRDRAFFIVVSITADILVENILPHVLSKNLKRAQLSLIIRKKVLL
jgi:hypothetical protein